MHYQDGTEARIGDVVVGKGYNVKDSSGQLKTITGVMHQITPGSDTCNCQVLLLEPITEKHAGLNHGNIWGSVFVVAGRLYHTRIEYGQCNHFDLTTPRVPD